MPSACNKEHDDSCKPSEYPRKLFRWFGIFIAIGTISNNLISRRHSLPKFAMIIGKHLLTTLFTIIMFASCQNSINTADNFDRKIWECDSIIADCRAALDRESSYNVCTGLTYTLVEALEQKDSILWWKMMEQYTGDEKLFLYQQFLFDRSLYRKFCDQNDSLSYHQDTEDPWWRVYSNDDKAHWLERHISILQQHVK